MMTDIGPEEREKLRVMAEAFARRSRTERGRREKAIDAWSVAALAEADRLTERFRAIERGF